ncbi:MAG: M14 family metallopeptidase, partial [Bacteroidota bacterium]
MKYLPFLLFLFLTIANAQDFKTEFEKSDGTRTATYHQTINFYQNLARTYPEISIQEIGTTDSGKPLHLVIFNTDFNSDHKIISQSSKATILINNGIHPGEPDGIDASMILLRDIVQDDELKNKFKDIIICVIPVYNIGGSLNRNSTSRVNQNGPESYGFRGNARNFDLNRDFIKNDTKNAQTFAEIFHLVDPDIFIENHVSNGADYQYTLTHLFTQHNKLGGELGEFLNNTMLPEIEKDLQGKDLYATPYVNVFNNVPDNGFSQFFDAPRYSTGYTTLFNTLGFMVETHMLKPYKQRVEATYEMMLSSLNFLTNYGEQAKNLRNKANKRIIANSFYPIQWEIDSAKITTLQFRGYNGNYIKSEVTGLNRLKYDRSKPFTKPVEYYKHFKPRKEIEIPKAYIIPQGWWKVIKRLNLNKIDYQIFETDTLISVESYKIEDFKTVKNTYEGHYLHYNTQVYKSTEEVNFRKGDLYIPTNQKG